MNNKAFIILNPSSGNEKSNQFKEKVKKKLVEQGYDVMIKETKKANDAQLFGEQACEQHVPFLTVMGGDGTISEVINGIAKYDTRPKLHIIPMGTVNNFARALQIPLEPKKAIDIIGNEEKIQIDLGKVNQQYFTNLVNVGAIAEATYEVTTEQKSKLGAFAYFFEGIKKFSEKELFSTTITTDDSTKEMEAMLVLVAVTDTVAGIKNIIKEAEIEDGYLHVFVFKEMTNLEGVSILTNLINGSLKEQEHIEYWKTKKLEVDTIPRKVANFDGDEGEATPLQFEILEKHLTVLK